MNDVLIMTTSSIESIVISSIIKEDPNYEYLLKDITDEFFQNKMYKIIFNTLQEALFTAIPVNKELLLMKAGLSAGEVETLYESEIINSMEDIKEFFIEYYKNIELDKGLKAVIEETNATEKFEKFETLQEKIDIKSTGSTLSDNKSCTSKYREYIESAQKAYEENDGVIGISTGIPELNEKIIGLKNIEYVLLAARPSMGKTSLASQMFIECVADTNEEGVPAFFSIEMETEQIMGRMVAQVKDDIDLGQTIFGRDRDKASASIEQALEFFDSHEYYIEDFSSETGSRQLNITPSDIDQKLAEMKKKHGKIKAIFIDFIQLLSPSNSRILGANERMTSISSQVKSLGRKYGCPVIALSQLNRDLEKRQDKRPQMSDLRDSGSLEQDADIIMFVYRADVYLEKEIAEALKNKPNDPGLMRQLDALGKRDYTDAEIIVGKQRNGPTGIVKTHFTKKNTVFGQIIDETEAELDELYGPAHIYQS